MRWRQGKGKGKKGGIVPPKFMKAGDWQCENTQCGNVCFSWRDACNRCSTPRSAESYLAEAREAKGKGKGKNGQNPDDWPCPTCGNFNWARRPICNQCDTPRSRILVWHCAIRTLRAPRAAPCVGCCALRLN